MWFPRTKCRSMCGCVGVKDPHPEMEDEANKVEENDQGFRDGGPLES